MHYTITFNTANDSFSIDFGNGYELHVDQKNHIARKTHNGELKDYFDTTGMSLDFFTQLVFNLEKSLTKN
jgi:hypothetical protein